MSRFASICRSGLRSLLLIFVFLPIASVHAWDWEDEDGDGLNDDVYELPPYEVTADPYDYTIYDYEMQLTIDYVNSIDFSNYDFGIDYGSSGGGDYASGGGTSIWDNGGKNQLTDCSSGGKDPKLDKYLSEVTKEGSDTEKKVSAANAVPSSFNGVGIWEAGVATVMDSAGNVIGNKELESRGPNDHISGADVSAAFKELGGDEPGRIKIFYHDHSEEGSVMTNADIESGATSNTIVIARAGDKLMIYVPTVTADGKHSGRLYEGSARNCGL